MAPGYLGDALLYFLGVTAGSPLVLLIVPGHGVDVLLPPVQPVCKSLLGSKDGGSCFLIKPWLFYTLYAADE